MSLKIVRLKESGHFDGEATVSEDKARLDKPVLMVYAGKFESMDGPVEIKDEDIEKLAANHNTLMSKLGRLASGDVHPRHNPPLQLDHSTSARDTVGRLVGNLTVGKHTLADGSEVKSLMGTARVLGKENVEKVEDGRWTHLSGGFDLENHKVSELTITPFPAAEEAHMLSKRLSTKEIDYKGIKVKYYQQTPSRKWVWDTKYHSGITNSESEAVAKAKFYIDQFEIKHPEMEQQLSKLASGEIALPGHVDEGLWNKAKDASQEAFGEVKWPFVNWWYQEQGGKFSRLTRLTEDHMGYKDLKHKFEMYEKCKKHLMDEKKMSEEDADKHLESAKDEELKHMAEEHDKHMKHLESVEEAERKKLESVKDAEEKHLASMKVHKTKLIELSKGMKETGVKMQLAEKKSKISVRLGRLRSERKVTPAEVKSLNLDELAGKSDEVVEAALASYEKREPVIDAGLYGTTKGLTAAQLATELKKMNMTELELQTRLNMPSKRDEAVKGLKGLEERKARLVEYGLEPHGHTEPDGDEHDPAQFEKMWAEMKRLEAEGKHDEAKEHLRKHMTSVHAPHMTESMPVSDPTPAMSALAKDFKAMQTRFEEFVKLAAPAFGATSEELN